MLLRFFLGGGFLLALLLPTLFSPSTALTTPLASPSTDTAHTVCKGDPLQPGEIITQQWTNWFQCSGGPWNPNNVLLVTPIAPSGASQICGDSPIPDGFVILQQSPSDDTCHDSSMMIQKPSFSSSNPVTVCASSPIPLGWITTGELDPYPIGINPCPLEHGAFLIKFLQAPSPSSMIVCKDSYIPPNFQIDNADTPDGMCLQDQGHSLSIEPNAGGPPLAS